MIVEEKKSKQWIFESVFDTTRQINHGPIQILPPRQLPSNSSLRHLPDLVNSKASNRATFYKEVANPFNEKPDHPRKYLALYQTDFEELLKSKEYVDDVRHDSQLFKKEGANSDKNKDNGDFDARFD